ncbi:hypothetical protein LSTR_LSTR009280 [Laodelphax striatellus]|uniref:Uncharacterized protein n=1 Tax=Laodelphax striatellus TaxID=195883 RepID=A0A482XMF1_LAOST|nr:hypothetical protein LSTR_LSTR009280 [Laodelphax striatellus]
MPFLIGIERESGKAYERDHENTHANALLRVNRILDQWVIQLDCMTPYHNQALERVVDRVRSMVSLCVTKKSRFIGRSVALKCFVANFCQNL